MSRLLILMLCLTFAILGTGCDWRHMVERTIIDVDPQETELIRVMSDAHRPGDDLTRLFPGVLT
jgi:hypothetical protein